MKAFRYIYLAIFAAAAVSVFFRDMSAWQNCVILAWPAALVAINEYQLNKKTKTAEEQAAHSTNSVPDQIHHAYQERS